jgi:hypothetical protein
MDMPYKNGLSGKQREEDLIFFNKLLVRYIEQTGYQFASDPLIPKAVHTLKKLVRRR